MAAGKKYPEQVYIEEEKNEKYMEGNYDGDADQQYKQERADKRRSIQMEEDIRASQEAVYEKETERLLGDTLLLLCEIARREKIPAEQVLMDRIEELIEEKER